MRTLAIGICYFYPEKEYLQNDACIPIQVGYEETHIDMGIQRDNEGDNRGNKHPYYSELSGLYWLWKNVDAEYKGLFHHRRALTVLEESLSSRIHYYYKFVKCALAVYFKNKEFIKSYEVRLANVTYKNEVDNFISTLIQKYLKKFDIIVPIPYKFWPMSIQRFFSIKIEDYIFQIVNDILDEKWPEYKKYWCKTLYGRNLYYANISIMRNHVFELYSNFIFGVLDLLEERLKREKYYISFCEEKSMSRKFGYIGELLTNTFIIYQRDKGVRIKEFYLMVNEDSKGWCE